MNTSYRYDMVLPEYATDFIYAINTCGALSEQQLLRLIPRPDKWRNCEKARNILRQLSATGQIIKKEDAYYSHARAQRDFMTELAFWVIIAYHKDIRNNYRAANYPAKLVFTHNDTRFVILATSGTGYLELEDIRQQDIPQIKSKYILIFNSKEEMEACDTSRVDGRKILFACIVLDSNGNPDIEFKAISSKDLNEN